MAHHADSVASKGGFFGSTGKILHAVSSREKEEQRRDRLAERDARAAALADRDIVALASVRLEGWEQEKEIRVRNAFARIVDREWYDKSEQTLKAVELGHINAVREHYAMKRDKIMTPSLAALHPSNARQGLPARGSSGKAAVGRASEMNTWNALEWADNVNAVDDLRAQDVNLQDHFLDLMRRKAAAKKLAEARPPRSKK